MPCAERRPPEKTQWTSAWNFAPREDPLAALRRTTTSTAREGEESMKRITLGLAAVILAALAIAPAQAAAPKLDGTVGPGFTITLRNGGTKVTKLKAGRYSIA